MQLVSYRMHFQCSQTLNTFIYMSCSKLYFGLFKMFSNLFNKIKNIEKLDIKNPRPQKTSRVLPDPILPPGPKSEGSLPPVPKRAAIAADTSHTCGRVKKKGHHCG